MEYRFSYREKNGSICLILSYKVGRRWKQKTKQGFKTQREARRYQDELLEQAREEVGLGPADPDLKKVTLRQFWELFARDRRSNLTYNTIKSYRSGLLAFKSILDIPIVDLTPAAVVNALHQIPTSPASVNYSLRVLKIILDHARVIYHLIGVSPARDIKQIKDARVRQLRAFSREELDRLLSTLKALPNKAAYLAALIAAGTGMRYGEVMGLTWADIDSLHQTVSVTKQWGLVDRGKYALKPTKTKNSVRTIHISSTILSALRTWKKQQPLSIDGRIFGGIDAHNFSNYINDYIQRDFPGRSFHSFRHTFATLLLEATGDVNLVAAVLGDTVATVSETYLDYTQDIRDRAAAEMECLL